MVKEIGLESLDLVVRTTNLRKTRRNRMMDRKKKLEQWTQTYFMLNKMLDVVDGNIWVMANECFSSMQYLVEVEVVFCYTAYVKNVWKLKTELYKTWDYTIRKYSLNNSTLLFWY